MSTQARAVSGEKLAFKPAVSYWAWGINARQFSA
jgi:hypothetical protein